ncbi:hypothetical protein [Streptomyces sp. NPDC004546]|uniref:hypothetical protein n=1 Tax=Streptomyces sp. NPDC004546 TaxID=3154282 RepID=UPI0033A4B477
MLGLELRRVDSGKRMTFGKTGKAILSQLMAENARVCWIEHGEPWGHGRLEDLRAEARRRARELAISA